MVNVILSKITQILLFQACILAVIGVIWTVSPQVLKQPISEEALQAVLNDQRYLMRQLKCALGEANCDPVGRRLKSKNIFQDLKKKQWLYSNVT